MADETPIPAAFLSLIPESLISVAENYWNDWCRSCEKISIDPLQKVPLAALGYTWACSDFVARNCIRYPDVFNLLHLEGFDSPRSFENYKDIVSKTITRSDAADSSKLMRWLRELRQQEMVRIAWRDLNKLADTKTILQELSDLAEAMVSITLAVLEKQQAVIYGMPVDADGEEQALVILAMGKMGGSELNFSSDIDLIFAYAIEGETSGPRRTSYSEFYLSVARKLVNVLNEVTADGFVYRVDTRLRPFGESGPLVISFSGMEQYYQLQGRDWERYAMIKAKLITGNESDKCYLKSMLTPFVYRRYLDFSMLESIREMKSMIDAQVKRKRMTNNIKLGRGGIREIEFIGQTLQLVRAGREPELRERSIVKVLSLLAEKQYLQKDEVEKLLEAYWFLRKLENRLQMQRDAQTHVLPEDEELRQRLCLAMDVPQWDELLSQLAQHQQCVDQVFENIIAHDTADAEPLPFSLLRDDEDSSDDLHAYLVKSGYTDADAILKSLYELRDSPQLKVQTGDNRRRLEQLLASLITQIATYPQQYELMDRISRIIKALVGRKVYISLLLEFSQVQQQMLKLCAASEWFTERLLKHPLLLDGLLVSKEILQQHYDQKHLLSLELNRIDSHGEAEFDLEQVMDRMRQFKRQAVFNVAVIDVFYEEPVETVSDR
ncbi:MAG: bifunctional [glutamate--ammonia ligase]-adenylyl-L-tyrosine phosphorylase/[glutamate--ammonia-ligase] adenylyltransferase, partial [Gammaproteobacteria bacterium]|nr:bifunctional [glutamate--ammonia ligase]-adenylyl-L-tyrosine phosphorylase/[glutamate--ammonia-ligase] adenylyltransferase [Gammaproteobacteria bacterium]